MDKRKSIMTELQKTKAKREDLLYEKILFFKSAFEEPELVASADGGICFYEDIDYACPLCTDQWGQSIIPLERCACILR